METENKRSVILLICSGILALIIIGLLYFLTNSKQEEVVVENTATDIYAGYEEYKVEEYGFSLKFPPTWKYPRDYKEGVWVSRTYYKDYNAYQTYQVSLVTNADSNIISNTAFGINVYSKEGWKQATSTGYQIYYLGENEHYVFGYFLGGEVDYLNLTRKQVLDDIQNKIIPSFKTFTPFQVPVDEAPHIDSVKAKEETDSIVITITGKNFTKSSGIYVGNNPNLAANFFSPSSVSSDGIRMEVKIDKILEKGKIYPIQVGTSIDAMVFERDQLGRLVSNLVNLNY